MTELFEINQQMLQAMRDLQDALAQTQVQSTTYAAAERDYKRSWAKAIVQSDGRNAEERAAHAEQVRFPTGDLSDIRYARDLAEGLKASAKLAVSAQMQVISALQTMASGMRQEMRFDQTGPQYGEG